MCFGVRCERLWLLKTDNREDTGFSVKKLDAAVSHDTLSW